MPEKRSTAAKATDAGGNEAEVASDRADQALASASELISSAVGLGNGENAHLLKRIAHCADGYRTNGEIHILMETVPPYRPLKVYRKGEDHPKTGAGKRLYGPFKSQEPLSTIYHKRKIEKVTITFAGGDTVDVTGADALFWRMSAVEKFCLPWYASQYGTPVAYMMWEHYARSDDIAALCHDPRSVACDVDGRVLGAEQLLTRALVALAR